MTPEHARKTAAYRLGYAEATAFITSNAMSACQPYRDHSPDGAAKDLAQYVMNELQVRRDAVGCPNSWEKSTATDRERLAEHAMKKAARGK